MFQKIKQVLLVTLFMLALTNSSNAQIGKLIKKSKISSKIITKKPKLSKASSSKSNAITTPDGKYNYTSIVKYEKEAGSFSGEDGTGSQTPVCTML